MARRAKQRPMPGTALDPEIEAVAEKYREARDARMEMQVDEESARDELTALMESKGLKHYVFHEGDLEVLFEEKVRVRKVKRGKPEGADDLVEDEAA
jgi:hypothetical protein